MNGTPTWQSGMCWAINVCFLPMSPVWQCFGHCCFLFILCAFEILFTLQLSPAPTSLHSFSPMSPTDPSSFSLSYLNTSKTQVIFLILKSGSHSWIYLFCPWVPYTHQALKLLWFCIHFHSHLISGSLKRPLLLGAGWPSCEPWVTEDEVLESHRLDVITLLHIL